MLLISAHSVVRSVLTSLGVSHVGSGARFDPGPPSSWEYVLGWYCRFLSGHAPTSSGSRWTADYVDCPRAMRRHVICSPWDIPGRERADHVTDAASQWSGLGCLRQTGRPLARTGLPTARADALAGERLPCATATPNTPCTHILNGTAGCDRPRVCGSSPWR